MVVFTSEFSSSVEGSAVTTSDLLCISLHYGRIIWSVFYNYVQTFRVRFRGLKRPFKYTLFLLNIFIYIGLYIFKKCIFGGSFDPLNWTL